MTDNVDDITLNMAEDAYQGNAQFTIEVDGVQIGGVQTVTALQSAGQTEAFTLAGIAAGPHTVSVDFLNDAWGGSAAMDRNLYVDSITMGGATIHENKEQGSSGTVNYIVSPPPVVAVTSQTFSGATTNAGSTTLSSAGSVTLQGTLSAAPGTLVQIFNASTLLGMATVNQNGTWAYTTVLPTGSYALHATATDPNGYSTATAAEPSFAVASAPATPTLAHPFTADSLWNTALSANATFESGTGVLTSALRTGAVAWVGPNSLGIYQASNSDPLATWTYQSSNGLGTYGAGQIQIRTPSAVQFMGGTDQLAVIVSPDQQSYYETWLGAQGATSGTYSAAYMVGESIDGTGFSTPTDPAQGIRAGGSSILAGLVRTQELNNLDIPHAIAMVIATTQAAAGATIESQYVYPATGTDYNSLTAYSGSIPIGTQFAIPSTVDLSTIGIKTPEGLALAKAYQLYGGYVVDTSPNTDVLASIETGASAQQVADLLEDIGTIRSYLSAVLSTAAPTVTSAVAPAVASAAVSTVAPTVAITSQTLAADTGASSSDLITSNGHVTLAGTETGPAGTTVVIDDGTTQIGTATLASSGAWTYSGTLGAGTHTLEAVATNPSGQTASTAAQPTITVLTGAPTVAITSQTLAADTGASASDLITSNGHVTLTGTEAGPAGTTVVIDDGTTQIGTATLGSSGAWTYSGTLGAGTHTLRAVATDLAGNTASTAAQPSIMVLTGAPTVAITSQTLAADTGASASDRITSNGHVTLAGTEAGPAGTTVVIDDGTTPIGTATLGSSGAWTYSGTLGAGTHTLHAVATDLAGNTASTAAQPSITVLTGGPALAITSQQLAADTGASSADNITRNGAVTLKGTLGGPAGSTVQIDDGSTVLGAATSAANGTWTYSTVLGAGTHALHATATDLAGNVTSTGAQASITVQTANPVLAVTAVTPSPSGTGATLTGTVSGGVGTAVQLFDGTTALGAATLDGRGGWSFGDPSATGTRTLMAVATDLAGNSASAASTFTVAPASQNTLVLNLSEDAYNGNAQFTVSVDGTQVGGVQSVTALHGSGQSQAFSFTGTFAAGAHDVAVDFLNDAWGGTAALDRNLYVGSIAMGGQVTVENSAQMNQGVVHYAVQDSPTAPSALTTTAAPALPAPDTLTLSVAEDAYLGDAQFTVTVDGTAVGGPQTVTASHNAGNAQNFVFAGNFGSGQHVVAVNFINDAWGGSSATDRNLYVNSIALDGATTTENAAQDNQGVAAYAIAAAPSANPGPDALTVGAGATLIIDKTAAASAAVTMTGSNATAEFTSAPDFNGTITGFAGSDTLDLRSIAFSAQGTTQTYTANATGGVLGVTDGTNAAHLNLKGTYAGSAFQLSADGHGGTAVTLLHTS